MKSCFSRFWSFLSKQNIAVCDLLGLRWNVTALKKVAFAILMIAFVRVPADANIWYIDSSVSVSGNGTSWSSAWKNISNISGISAGDTVYISGGPSGSSQTYSVGSSFPAQNGTTGVPITYQIGQDSLHNGTAILSGSGGSYFINGATHDVVISGDAGDGQMHFTASGFTCVIIASPSDFRISYINFGLMNGAGGPYDSIIQASPCSGFQFDHNYVFCSNPALNTFMYFQPNTGGSTNYVDTQINNNIIWCPRTVDGSTDSQGGDGADFIESGTCSGFSIYSNLFAGYTTNYTYSQHQDGWQDTGGTSFVKVYDNTFLDICEYGVYCDGYYGGFNNILIYNNINCYSDSALANGGAGHAAAVIVCEYGSGTGPVPCVISNCLIANNLAADYGSANAGGMGNFSTGGTQTIWTNDYIENNIAVNCGVANDETIGANDIGRPILVDNPAELTTASAATNFVSYTQYAGTNNNFRLLSTAAGLIRQGANLSSCFTKDRNGNPRPATGAWDIGPYMYGSNGSSTNPSIYVTPSTLNFGTVLAGASVTNSFTVQNTGGGTLTGAATVAAPFDIVSGGSYSLTNNQTRVVQVSYTPSGAATDSQTVSFTVNGGNGTSAAVTGSLLPVLPGLSFQSFAGVITAPFVTNSGGYISQSITTGVTNGGTAVYAFMITNATNYVVSAMVNAPSTAADSFYVNIDAQPTDPTMIWDTPVTSGFTNSLVSWRGSGTDTNDQYNPEIFNLSTGVHQLIVVGREGGTELGQISIVAVPPAPTGLHVISP